MRYLLVFMVLLMACKSKPKGSFEVSGSVKNFEQMAALFPSSVTDGKMRLLLFEVPFGNEGLSPSILLKKQISIQYPDHRPVLPYRNS